MNKFIKVLLVFRKIIILKHLSYMLMKLLTIEIPLKVKIGNNLELKHQSAGTVIHPNTIIGNNVSIYQGVTVGRADAYINYKYSKMRSIKICDEAVLCAGAKILCKEGTLVVGKGAIIGANSVLFNSTGDYEIWAGSPAKKIGTRTPIKTI